MRKSYKSLLLEIPSGILIIYVALWLGKLLSNFSGQLLPASIMGMLLLTAALQLRWVKLNWVECSANQFVRWMSLLFVPISIGLVENIETLLQALPAMLLTCGIATLVLLVAVGRFYQFWEARSQHKADAEDEQGAAK